MHKALHTLKIFYLLLIPLVHLSTYQATAQNSRANQGIVKGYVYDRTTGQGVSFSQVVINGTNINTITDSLGYYEIPDAPLGYQRVLFTNLGYQDLLSDPLLITVAKPQNLDVYLIPDTKQIQEIQVTGQTSRRTESVPLSNYKLNIQQIEKSPGSTRDISKVVQNIPGVVATPIQRNDLLVRGGGPNENKFFIDRIEVPTINHFATQGSSGGNASIVNTDFLSNATLYTSAYPASKGGALSSVLDLRLKEGNAEKARGKFSIGASDLAISLDAPMGKDGAILASYRRSYLQFLFSALKLPFLPTYDDGMIKVNYRIDPRNSIMILALGAIDKSRLNTGMTNMPPDREYILDYLPENDQWNYTIGAVYTHYTKSSGILNAIISTNDLNNKITKWQDNDESKGYNFNYNSRQRELKARIEYNQPLASGYTISAGISFDHGYYSNNTLRRIYANQIPIFINSYSNLDLSRGAIYAAVDKSFWQERLRLLLSLRSDMNDYNSHMRNPLSTLSPSLAMSVRIARPLTFSASVGRYYQEPSYTTMGYRDPSSNKLENQSTLRHIASDQVSAGLAYTFTPTSRLSVEGFYKTYAHYPVSLTDSIPIGSKGYDSFTIGSEAVASVGKGRAYGVELMYRDDDLWGNRLNISYTYYFSEFRRMSKDFTPTGPYSPSNWDNRNLITLVFMRDFGRGWEAGLRWRYAGGAPYTPYDEDLSAQIDAWDETKQPYADYTLYNTLRSPSFHQLDLRIDKTFYFRRWTLALYIDIQNLYNYKAIGPAILTPEKDASGNYIKDPDRPGYYKMQRIANEIGGTIIPTFGLIIEI